MGIISTMIYWGSLPEDVDKTNANSESKILPNGSGTYIEFEVVENYAYALRIWQEPNQNTQDYTIQVWFSTKPWGNQIYELPDAVQLWHPSKSINRITAIVSNENLLDKYSQKTEYVGVLLPGIYYINVNNLENKPNPFRFHIIGEEN